MFKSDANGEAESTLQTLIGFAGVGSELTFTVVPAGTGTRIGIDRDENGTFDFTQANPPPPDTDGDGLIDSVETNTGIYVSPTDTGTNPNNPDSDGDGINDGAEVTAGTDPNVPQDTDGDGLNDIVETHTGVYVSPTNTGTDPNDPDTDNDGVNDGDEVTAGTDPNVADRASGGGGHGGGGCFIATAAYGTPMANEISALRDWRDSQLLTGALGAAFTDAYYRMSPPAADFIATRPALRSAARVIIAPAIEMVESSSARTSVYGFAAALLAGFSAIALRLRRAKH